jgi:hypothetical protein
MQPIDVHNVFEEMLNPEPVTMKLDRQPKNGPCAEIPGNVRPGVQVELDDPGETGNLNGSIDRKA